MAILLRESFISAAGTKPVKSNRFPLTIVPEEIVVTPVSVVVKDVRFVSVLPLPVRFVVYSLVVVIPLITLLAIVALAAFPEMEFVKIPVTLEAVVAVVAVVAVAAFPEIELVNTPMTLEATVAVDAVVAVAAFPVVLLVIVPTTFPAIKLVNPVPVGLPAPALP